MTLGVGIIGCGRAGRELHLPALERVSGLRIVALADSDASQLEAARERCGAEGCHTDYRSLLEDPGVDIALVAVPPAGHEAAVRAALEAGKHVLAEKPLAASPAEARGLVALAEKTSLVTAVGHNLRCHRLLRAARDRIQEGAIGTVEAIRSLWSSDIALRSNLPDWRSRRKTHGGVIHEMGIHQFDLWRFLLGVEFEQVSAVSHPGDRDDDTTALSCLLTGGIPGTMMLSQRSAVALEIEVLGSTGRLSIDCYRFDGLRVTHPGDPPGSAGSRLRDAARTASQLPLGLRVARRGGDFLDSYRVEWESLLNAVDNGSAVPCSFEDGYQAVVAANAAARSAELGTVVST